MNKKIMFDTSIIIEILRGNKIIIQQVGKKIDYQEIIISFITRLEVINGIRKEEKKDTLYFLEEICKTISISDKTFLLAEEILQHQRKNGFTIDIPDAIIGANAIENNFMLMTLNIKHFENIKNLESISNI